MQTKITTTYAGVTLMTDITNGQKVLVIRSGDTQEIIPAEQAPHIALLTEKAQQTQ